MAAMETGESIVTCSPRIVAIETSSRIGSVAVACGKLVLGERQFSKAMRHAVELMPAIRDLAREQGWKPGDIDQVYVSALRSKSEILSRIKGTLRESKDRSFDFRAAPADIELIEYPAAR